MSYYTTGLEGLLEKVAIAMPANAKKNPLGGRPDHFKKGAKKPWGAGKKLLTGAAIGTGIAALGAGWALKKDHDKDRLHRNVSEAPMAGTAGTSAW
jgi:hypothetical protein